MKFSKIFQLSLNMLVHSKLRSWLTIIGIFIGVAAVVAIISVGQGLQENVNSQIQGLGQDLISISAGSARAFGGPGSGGGSAATNVKKLSERDVQALKLVPGIKYINPSISGRADIKYQSETASMSIQGGDPALLKEFVTTAIDSGRYIGQGEIRAVVIGDRVAHDVFRGDLNVGYLITINDIPFRVVGILEPSSGFGSSDNAIYMSTKDAREVLADTLELEENEYSSISVKVDDPTLVEEVTNKIETTLQNVHHVTPDKQDFSVTSAAALQERFSAITSGVTIFLGVIAAVSLFVGGIGVANTMFTSVLEKTKDIGIMKAIGAKNSDILLIFLFNSGLLGLVGGILGIIFGVSISYILPSIGFQIGPGGNGGLNTVISLNLLIFALVFSMLIGMISGALPAYRASKLKPIEALRHE